VWCVDGAWALFENCIFSGNYAEDAGGAICSSWGWPQVIDCLFTDNHAAHGGGMAVIAEGTITLENSIFVGNSAEDGGALYFQYWAESQITGCTIGYNEAARGAGITVLDSYWGLFTISRTIVAFGEGGEGLYWGGEGDFALACCNLFGNEGGDWVGNIAPMLDLAGNFSANPCFCEPETGDYSLCANSVCLPGAHPWGCDEELIGAVGEGCGICDCWGPIEVEARSWGAVKDAYR
jgi:predicted outer membrane repeat protein